MKKDINDFLEFLDETPTAWHVVYYLQKKLEKAGYIQLLEEDSWKLKANGKYYVIRNGSSICAFILPSKPPQKARILGSHTDSPGLKLKPKGEFYRENMVMLGIEAYGSPLYTSWINRDLGIAGRVSYIEKKQMKQKLIKINDVSVFIPQLAIHLDRQVNEKGLVLNPHEQLSALAALSDNIPKESFIENLVKKHIGSHTPLSYELFLYPLEKARLAGLDGEFVVSQRLDNLGSVHSSLTALLASNAKSTDTIQMAIFWDNEEIGSSTDQGADSPFLPHTLERILLALDQGREEYFRLLSRSLCISIDLAHAVHPNYMDKHDPRHPTLLGKGPILKTNAQKKYMSDAETLGWVINVCQDNKIPYQIYSHRADMTSGSTIGPINAALTGMKTIDIGYPELSMHSSRELASVKDHLTMCKLLQLLLLG
jgi:aspartyl aminopeptidase